MNSLFEELNLSYVLIIIPLNEESLLKWGVSYSYLKLLYWGVNSTNGEFTFKENLAFGFILEDKLIIVLSL